MLSSRDGWRQEEVARQDGLRDELAAVRRQLGVAAAGMGRVVDKKCGGAVKVPSLLPSA